jgi:hypothetical protein
MASPPTSHSPVGWAVSSSESAACACCGERRERHEAKPGERACAQPPWHRRSEQGGYSACVCGLTLGVSRALGGGKARHYGQAPAHPGDCSYLGGSGAHGSGAPSVSGAPPCHKRCEWGGYSASIGSFLGGKAVQGGCSARAGGFAPGGSLALGGDDALLHSSRALGGNAVPAGGGVLGFTLGGGDACRVSGGA